MVAGLFCSSTHLMLISVSLKDPLTKKIFQKALHSQLHVHVNYLNITFYGELATAVQLTCACRVLAANLTFIHSAVCLTRGP